MIIYPAIDMKGGRCVRLLQGRAQNLTDYGDPLVMARRWAQDGARWLHLVDLDGAFDGAGGNLDAVERIARELDIPVQLGGGIRTMQDIENVLKLGVWRVIIGSAAVKDPEFVRDAVLKYGEKIAVGIDARGGTVRTEGWLKDSGEDFLQFASLMDSYCVQTIIFTDIDKDGMLAGPNFDQLSQLRQAVSCQIIASGGVTTLDDVKKLHKLGIDGAIAGKAVYTGSLDLAAAIRAVED